MMRIAINGFGRIGRTFLRTLFSSADARKKIAVIAVNIGPEEISHTAHLFKYDTLMGIYPGSVEQQGNSLIIDGHALQLIAEVNPLKLPWQALKIDWVVECSGRFTTRDGAVQHQTAGAHAVLISAPATDEDIALVPGVNDDAFDATQHTIVSLGSCTTNALVTMLKVVHDSFAIEHAYMTTIHAYTSSQHLLDNDHKDLRRARAAALNIIPTSTGAQKVVGKVIPALEGRLQASALRVPVGKVSLIDLVVTTHKELSVRAINDAFVQAAKGSMKGIMGVCNEPLVSSDFYGNVHSAIVDTALTMALTAHSTKIFGWYDNEWGYSCRLRDFLLKRAE